MAAHPSSATSSPPTLATDRSRPCSSSRQQRPKRSTSPPVRHTGSKFPHEPPTGPVPPHTYQTRRSSNESLAERRMADVHPVGSSERIRRHRRQRRERH